MSEARTLQGVSSRAPLNSPPRKDTVCTLSEMHMSSSSMDPFDLSYISPLDPFLLSTSVSLSPCIISILRDAYHYDHVTHVLKYKAMARKVKPVASATPPEFRVERFRVGDPMAQLPPLPTDPPLFSPGIHITAERAKALDIDPTNFLWPEERKLVWWLIKTHEEALSCTELVQCSEHG